MKNYNEWFGNFTKKITEKKEETNILDVLD